MKSKKVFISYNREDEWFAVHARDALKARLGSQLEIFIDQESLRAGQRWRHELDKNARASAIVLLIVGPYWSQPEFIEELKAGNKFVLLGEIELAFAETKLLPIIPYRASPHTINVDDYDNDLLANALSETQHKPFEVTSAEAWDQLAADVRSMLGISRPVHVTDQTLISLGDALKLRSSLQESPQRKKSDATGIAMFVMRQEFFGSLIYTRNHDDYIAFDHDATEIFELSQTHSLDEIYQSRYRETERKSFDTFVELCTKMNLFNAKGRFTGVFIKNETIIEGRLTAPLVVHWSCSRQCNFQCNHCYSKSGEADRNELSTEQARTMIDEMAEMGCFRLSIGGGEPLLRSDIFDVIEHANSRGISVSISTNAAAITDEIVEQLDNVDVSGFKISMESASEEIYESIRGKEGAFKQALAGIERLKTLDIPMYLHTVLMQPNAGEIPGLIKLAETLEIDRLVLTTAIRAGRAIQHPDLLLGRERINRIWEEATQLQKKTKVKLEIPIFPQENKRLFEGYGCECGRVVCHIDARGNVKPTGFFQTKTRGGNVKRNSLKQIWNYGASFVEFRNFKGNSTCNACDHFTGCRGGCRMRAKLEDGDIDLPDPNCPIAYPISNEQDSPES